MLQYPNIKPAQMNVEAQTPIVALHCSGSSGAQWNHLRDYFSNETMIMTPDLKGAEMAQFHGTSDCALAIEAEPVVSQLRAQDRPCHIVGHSFGGALALHIARNHPELVASLCLYEPTAFNLLATSGQAKDMSLAEEIRVMATSIAQYIDDGYDNFAAQVFTDFWGGYGAWQALPRHRRNALTTWVPKCPLDFAALLNEPVGQVLDADIPMTLIVGEHTHAQTRRIVELLNTYAPRASIIELKSGDHLGPFVFRDQTALLIQKHVLDANADRAAARGVNRMAG